MTIYRVTARLKAETAGALRRKLDDGSIAAQPPDGQEMVDAFGRATVTESGDVRWSETCYCPTPLAHERATVLDRFFENLTTEPIGKSKDISGVSWRHGRHVFGSANLRPRESRRD